jgi:hypothetical protein
VKDMLKRFDTADSKPIKTLMALNGHLDLNEEGNSVDQKVFHSMIGSLLYLCASRLDIMLSVCMCARFQANPEKFHLMFGKRIFRYLLYTPHLSLWHPKGSTFDLLGYSDSDYAGCKVDERVLLGLAYLLVGLWCHGAQRNKIQLLYPWPKTSMWWSVLVVHNSCGWSKC